jgi:hypothetical protein
VGFARVCATFLVCERMCVCVSAGVHVLGLRSWNWGVQEVAHGNVGHYPAVSQGLAILRRAVCPSGPGFFACGGRAVRMWSSATLGHPAGVGQCACGVVRPWGTRPAPIPSIWPAPSPSRLTCRPEAVRGQLAGPHACGAHRKCPVRRGAPAAYAPPHPADQPNAAHAHACCTPPAEPCDASCRPACTTMPHPITPSHTRADAPGPPHTAPLPPPPGAPRCGAP